MAKRWSIAQKLVIMENVLEDSEETSDLMEVV